jgi:hypothetical protein
MFNYAFNASYVLLNICEHFLLIVNNPIFTPFKNT